MRRPGRWIRGWLTAALTLAVALAASAPCAAMTWPPFVPDTVAVMPDVAYPSPTAPRLAVDPVDGRVHLVYEQDDSVWHEPRGPGAPGGDLVASGVELLDWAIGPTGRPAAACVREDSIVIVVRRDAAGWSPDTVVGYPGWTYTGALAIAADDAPLLALMAASTDGTVNTMTLWRRGPAGWSRRYLSLGGPRRSRPSMALDGAGRVHLAWLDWMAASGALFYRVDEPSGGYQTELIDTAATSEPSLALDPATGEPRIAYLDRYRFPRYAWRSGGAWHDALLPLVANGPPALSIAPDGSATIVATMFTTFEPRLQLEPRPSCPSFRTGSVVVAQGLRNDDPASFERTYQLHLPSDDCTGPRGAVALAAGRACIGWSVCGYGTAVWLARQDGAVVPPLPDNALLATPGPNPAREGAPLTLSFRMSAPGDVAFTLHDVAGRRVAERAVERFGAGPHGIHWAPGALAPGVYALTLHVDGRRVESRTLVVLR